MRARVSSLLKLCIGAATCRFEPVVSAYKGLIPDGFIYLAASPETCMRRMKLRGRGEEGGVSLEYLENLHSKHEEWLHLGALKREDASHSPQHGRNQVHIPGA